MDHPMHKSSVFRPSRSAGFTLVELMVVVVVVAILATIALPSYQASVRKSRRTEVKTALLDLAGREERFMATNGSYTTSLSQLGWSSSTTSSGYYTIVTPTVTAGAAATLTASATPSTFLLAATTAGVQTKDTSCTKFTVDQAGNQLSYDSSSAVSTGCW
jgi:type IV pilus assembly protein PilE